MYLVRCHHPGTLNDENATEQRWACLQGARVRSLEQAAKNINDPFLFDHRNQHDDRMDTGTMLKCLIMSSRNQIYENSSLVVLFHLVPRSKILTATVQPCLSPTTRQRSSGTVGRLRHDTGFPHTRKCLPRSMFAWLPRVMLFLLLPEFVC